MLHSSNISGSEQSKKSSRFARLGKCVCRLCNPSVNLRLDDGTRSRKSFAGATNEFVLSANTVFQRRQHFCTEGFPVGAVRQELHDRLVTVKISKDTGWECHAKFLFHYLGVWMADPKGNEGSYIAENRLPDRERKLVNVLMGEGEA